MKLEEFKENYNYAPIDINEFAELASNVSDDKELAKAASKFLQAHDVFLRELSRVEVEIG